MSSKMILESLASQGTFFDVKEEPVKTESGKVFPGKKAIVRADDGTPLSVVSKGYRTVRNEEIFTQFGDAIDKSKIRVEGATADVRFANKGARTMVTLHFPAHRIKIRGNDESMLQITCRNSYDGRWNFSVKGGALRAACLNGMLLGDWIGAYSEYHNSKLSVEHAAAKLVYMAAQFDETPGHWERMIGADVTEEKAWRVFCLYTDRKADFKRGLSAFNDAERPNVATKLLEQWRAREAKDLGENAFSVYNTLTHHATHSALREGKEAISLQLRQAKVEQVLSSKYWTERVVGKAA